MSRCAIAGILTSDWCSFDQLWQLSWSIRSSCHESRPNAFDFVECLPLRGCRSNVLDSPNSQAIDIVAGPRLLPIFKSQRALDDAGSAGLHSRHRTRPATSVVAVFGLFLIFLYVRASISNDIHSATPISNIHLYPFIYVYRPCVQQLFGQQKAAFWFPCFQKASWFPWPPHFI